MQSRSILEGTFIFHKLHFHLGFDYEFKIYGH